MRPPAATGVWTVRALFWHNLRLYHILVRVFFVVPGHTVHTRAQNLALLLLQWLLWLPLPVLLCVQML